MADNNKTTAEIYFWNCPICEKPLRSLYEAQLESNKKEHLSSHETKK